MNIIKMLCPESKWGIKAPFEMEPDGITIHNTANDACAKAEISYMITNNYKVSYHWAVDDINAVQGIPHNRNAWHAGDGRNGYGNKRTIGIEICYSKSGGDRFLKAEDNAAELIARIMLTYGWGMDRVGTTSINTHRSRSGKYCPHRTLDMGMTRFYEKIGKKYAEISGKPIPKPEPLPDNSFTTQVGVNALNIRKGPGTDNEIVGVIRNRGVYTIVETKDGWGRLKSGLGWISLKYTNFTAKEAPKPKGHYVGEVVNINGVYTSSSSTTKLKPAVTRGTITKIIQGARNPYLLNDGNIGWVNDECIIGGNNPEPPKPNPGFYKGQRVTLLTSAQRYCTGEKIPSSIKGKVYTIMQVGSTNHKDGLLLKEIMSWVYKNDVR